MYKAIFWDIDGLLIDTEFIYFKTTQKALSEHGIKLTQEYFESKHLTGEKYSYFSLAKDAGFSDEKIGEIREKRNKIFVKTVLSKNILIDGVVDTFEKMRGKIRMAGVTNSQRANSDASIKSSGLDKYFEFRIVQEDVVKGKPDPECYLLALEKSRLRQNECVVFEDTMRGVQTARLAGIDCYAIPSKYTQKHDFSMANGVLKSIKEVPKIVI
ncbi:MAG: hypothetical protein COT81_02100 [Candidatus Buchananbacteria bacterium CG10_big_fil_rev_8_21_14_0_10_42_9]|uniref:HAD family phosphatase n=1 Tax=Candidatus Buchananbacteria bacterium CG10_big_fil_rev_8_21_14_0_10_42_9 TaxID=1974526 RepID=A0A2H0W1J0_9BACT|nr:MAG: hypothetical protein COT81_02100 [Candidatus Buchananbacteria bacterium CG10_big_fil_rev_8_21_14_0_10_42_9]